MLPLVRWQAIADLLILTISIYLALSWARRARALRLVITLIALHAASLVARHFEMLITAWVLEASAVVALVVLVLAFQAEVRYAVLRLDGLLRLWPRGDPPPRLAATVIGEAAFEMAAESVGSLMVIVRSDPVGELVHDGVPLDAGISVDLLETIFQKGTPLHDGAVLVEDGRLSRAGVFLPLTQRAGVPAYFGTRHRAAMGLADRCDAVVVVTSEERGDVSLIEGDRIQHPRSPQQLADALERLARRPERRIANTASRALFFDLRLKAAALGISAVIWTTAFLLAGTTVRSVRVPVEFSNVPAVMEVASQSTDRLDVQLRGNAWVMDSLNVGNLVAHLDLSSAAPGVASIRVGAADFDLPTGVVVDRTVPPTVTVSLARAAKH